MEAVTPVSSAIAATTAAPPSQSVRWTAAGPVAAACAGVAGLAYVAANNPNRAGAAFPACPFHAATGLWCPGCGMTRATYALLHGDLGAAFSANVFLPVFALLAVAGWVTWFLPTIGREPPRAIWRLPVGVWIGFGASLLAFGVLRNLPLPGFRALAP
jgi:Protein of unknown function (DUF2752)